MPETPFPDVPGWEEPPARSQRCLDLLARLQAGAWRPTEATMWREDRDAAKRTGVHPWEWRNLISPAWAALAVAKPNCRWPVRRLAHCPDPILLPASERAYSTGDGWRKVIQAFCCCPEPDADAWHSYWHRTHWVNYEGTALYCQCGPRDDPPGSGNRWINDDGYVCEDCARLLITTHWTYGHRREITEAGHPGEGPSWLHLLKQDCRCCYCGGTALERRGWRLRGHPPMATREAGQ